MKCIYMIINLINHKKYIGSTTNFARRKANHLSKLRNSNHSSMYLQSSYNKHGENMFEFIILKKLPLDEDMYTVEQQYLDQLKTYDRQYGYNMSPTANGPYGYNFHNRVLQYSIGGQLINTFDNCVSAALAVNCNGSGLSKCCRGKYRYYAGYVWVYERDLSTIEVRLYKANNKPKMSEETKEKIRVKRKLQVFTNEDKLKMSRGHKGKIPKNLSKIQKDRAKPVLVYDKNMNFIKEYRSVRDCQKIYPGCGSQLWSSKSIKPREFTFKFKENPIIK